MPDKIKRKQVKCELILFLQHAKEVGFPFFPPYRPLIRTLAIQKPPLRSLGRMYRCSRLLKSVKGKTYIYVVLNSRYNMLKNYSIHQGGSLNVGNKVVLETLCIFI